MSIHCICCCILLTSLLPNHFSSNLPPFQFQHVADGKGIATKLLTKMFIN